MENKPDRDGQAAALSYVPLENAAGESLPDRVAILALNRPAAANAFNGAMLEALTEAVARVHADPHCRVLLVQGVGKHFSAGADLHWMKEAAQMGEEGNRRESEKILGLFSGLAALRIPTIAVVRGAAFGGAVGIAAACDYAIATETARFCLSEVKVGLLPAVILPYVARKIGAGHVRRLSLQGRVFEAAEAQGVGLVQLLTKADALNQLLIDEVNALCAAAPGAQRALKALQAHLDDHSLQQGAYTVDAIVRARASAEGQGGVQAFFSQQSPAWVAKVPASAQLAVM